MRKIAKFGLASGLACMAAMGVLAPVEAQSGKAAANRAAASAIPAGDWRTINRDLSSDRFSPLDEINKSNVADLTQKWSYPLKGFNSVVPLVIGGTMYVSVGTRVVALDADTGKEIWVYEEPKGSGPGGGMSGRGVAYWPGKKGMAPRIVVMAGSRMLELDAATGKKVAKFGKDGEIDVSIAYGGVPTISGDVAIIGAASLESPQGNPGNPRAYDVVTGKKLWEFDTTPDAGQPFNDTWGEGWKDRGGTNMWGFQATVDESTGTAYLPIAGPAHNYYGGDRPGSNVFGNSVVAVDLKTGAYKWHFQTVHHDLWDIDMSYAGPLFTVDGPDGKQHKVIANVGKNSMFFVLDAADGKPVLPVEERPVPPGDVPGEYYSPTQPFPVVTPPLSRVEMTYQDMVTAEDTTPEHVAACRDLWQKAGGFFNAGPFTPFMFKAADAPPRSTIQFPGGTGGVNWGGTTVNPHTGVVFANAQDGSLVGWVEKVVGDKPYSFDASIAPEYDRAFIDGVGPFHSFTAPISGKYDDKGRPVGPQAPCYKPPWATLTAVDANTGKIKWAVPLGLNEGLPEGKQLVGNSGSAGPTATAGGLVFIGATNDKRFRAFDQDTGKQLWEAALPGNANANPMSYRGKSGKQYVAINAGGTIVAYALR